MDIYLPAAIKRLNIQPEQVVKSRIEGSELVVLVDYGIGGIKKYRLALAELHEEPEPEIEIEAEPKLEPEVIEVAGVIEPFMVVPPGNKGDTFTAVEPAKPEPKRKVKK